MQKQKTFKFGWWRDDEIDKIKDFCKGADYFECGNFNPYDRHNGYEDDIEKFLDVIPLAKVKLTKRIVKVWKSEPGLKKITATTFANEI